VSEWYFVFSIAHKVTIGFAVIGVINGVFMQARRRILGRPLLLPVAAESPCGSQETFKVAGSDDKIMMRQRVA